MQRQWTSNSFSEDNANGWPHRNEPMPKRKRKILVIEDDDDSGDEVGVGRVKEGDSAAKRHRENREDEEEEEMVMEVLKPIGEVVRVSGWGTRKVNHYKAFECEGRLYQLEDSVLMSPACPENETQKPNVAIIKDITHKVSTGKVTLIGQRFYRPEEAKKKEGGSWQTCYLRELFYSFHKEEFAAETVMHTCTVNFVPLHKQLPHLKQYPGFIVQKVYDTEQKKLFNLKDMDYEIKQSEIDHLLNKTTARLGDLPDLDIEDDPVDVGKEGQTIGNTLLSESNLSPTGKLKTGEGLSKYLFILTNFRALTNSPRDEWLWRLLQSVEYVCTSSDAMQEGKGTGGCSGSNHSSVKRHAKADNGQDKGTKGKNQLIWPDSAVRAVTDLERVSYGHYTKYAKYNQKMRQLVNKLKSSALLAQRLLKQELKPMVILKMEPLELMEGLTAEEIARNKPEETMRVQMTDAQCRRCSVREVSRANIIKAGTTERYEMECLACGHSWYMSRESAATMKIYEPSDIKNVRKPLHRTPQSP